MKIIRASAFILFALLVGRSVSAADWQIVASNRLHGITATPNGTLWSVGTTGVFAKPERTLILRKTP